MPPKSIPSRKQWAQPSDPKRHTALRALRAQSNSLNAQDSSPHDENPWASALDAQETLEALAQAKSRARQQLAVKGAPTRDQQQKGREKASKRHESDVGNPNAKILRIPGGVLYVGEVSGGRPHGHGDLILKDGTTHRGEFREGRAHGDGILYGKNGTVHQGTWNENRRVGIFWMLDSNGKEWEEEYGLDGKRTSRSHLPATNAYPAALECVHCSSRFHESFSVRRCKQHKGEWRKFADPDMATFPEGGMWMCCGEKRFEDGVTCSFGCHSHTLPECASSTHKDDVSGGHHLKYLGGLPNGGFQMPDMDNKGKPSEMDQLHALGDKKFGKPRSGRFR